MALPERMKFGIFLGPYHPMNDNPTVAFQRDLELIQWLDDLAFDEAYIGEHHSGGWETISSPEVFIAALADRTKSIKLGTGVLSLPYHHPLMAANRLVLLDHITRGRLMIGVGPGGLNADAYMMGIDTTVQRARMEEALDVLIRLFTETEPISHESDWFKLQDAHLQVRPYQRPHPPIAVSSIHSPAGVALAGKHGTSVLSMSIDQNTDLSYQWGIAEESAARHGQTVRRENWRMVMPVHVAETRQQAFEDIRSTAGVYQREYLEHTLTLQIGDTPMERIVEEMSESGSWIVGSPDDCIQAIHNLDKEKRRVWRAACPGHRLGSPAEDTEQLRIAGQIRRSPVSEWSRGAGNFEPVVPGTRPGVHFHAGQSQRESPGRLPEAGPGHGLVQYTSGR